MELPKSNIDKRHPHSKLKPPSSSRKPHQELSIVDLHGTMIFALKPESVLRVSRKERCLYLVFRLVVIIAIPTAADWDVSLQDPIQTWIQLRMLFHS